MKFIRFLSVAVVLAALATAQERAYTADPLDEPPPTLVHPHLHTFFSAVSTRSGVVAVGERGVVVREIDDHEEQWEQIEIPFRRTLTAITESESGRLYAVGHDALIATAPKSGDDWKLVYSDVEFDAPLLDIWVGADGFGIGVGAYGLALATDDHGESWRRLELDPDEPHFNAIRRSADGTLFIVGEFSTALRSRDNGQSWERLAVDFDSTFYGLRTDRNGRVLLYGFDGWIAESLDAGDSWTVLDSGTSNSLYDAVFLDDGRAVIVGSFGTVLVESLAEQGRFHNLTSGTGSITSVLIDDDGMLLVFGTDGIGKRVIPSGD